MRTPAESIRQAFSKTNQHATNFARRVDEVSPSRATHEPKVGRQLDMRGKFVSGAKRKINESSHVSIAAPATSFGDIRGNRDRGPSCLVDQAEPLRSRIPLRRPVNQHCEVPALLPDLQLPEVIHDSAICSPGDPFNTPEQTTVGRFCGRLSIGSHGLPNRLQEGRTRGTAYCLLKAAY